MANILVAGGAGYCGSVLVPKLLKHHRVTVLDLLWFGNHLKPHERLELIKADVRDDTFPLWGFDVVIHLAAIANDPVGELDPKLAWEVNALGTAQLADRSARAGVKQFIYASSGSVYGISDAPEVTEDHPLMPLSEYNKSKMVAERAVLSYFDAMDVLIIRPATVCGFSPRMRLDVMVNSFVMQALTTKVIKFNGGDQFRPNIHIDDLTDLYEWSVLRPGLQGIFNAGFENLRISELAAKVANSIETVIESRPTNDRRSYRLNSDKLLAAGFKPRKSVSDAIDELSVLYQEGKLRDDSLWYTVSSMPGAA